MSNVAELEEAMPVGLLPPPTPPPDVESQMQPQRSPERAALADAIERHSSAQDYLARVEDAIQRKNDAILTLWREIEAAEEALTKAKEREPSRLVAALVDGEAEQEESQTADEAESRLTSLRDQQQRARLDLALLKHEQKNAATSCSFAVQRRKEAIEKVVRAEGQVERLLALYDGLRARAAALLDALFVVSFAAPRNWRGQVVYDQTLQVSEIDPEPKNKWMAALKALETDPDALLPEIMG